MTNSNEQQQTQQAKLCLTFAEFLESTPPNLLVCISDLAELENAGRHISGYGRINTPKLELHCPHDSCARVMNFRCVEISRDGERLTPDEVSYFYIFYQCSNCRQEQTVFSLIAVVHKNGGPQGECCKLGEIPPYGPHVSSKLIELLRPDRDLFLQGRRCENQGFGIGAFAYYRRVVENQKNRILERILKVAKKIGTTPDTIDELNAAIKETQFKKALGMAKDVIPEKLFINDQNPILALHHALSVGVHNFSDEQCLALARDVRILLGDLSERMAFVIKDDAEVGRALSSLMNLGNN